MATLIARMAAGKPETAALIDERGETTWAAFDDRVNRLVNGLRAASLAEGDAVALLSGNRREAFEVTAAAMHAGWVVVPVNWHWTAEELAYVVADSGARALVVDGAFVDVAAEAVTSVVACDVRVAMADHPPAGFVSYEALLAAAEPTEPDQQVTGGPMFYTSGTTGFPKGVRSALTRVGLDVGMWELVTASFVGLLRLPSQGVTLLDGPAYHSAQWVFSIFPLLGAGSTLVMRHRFDPAETL
jgi:long-chain acyl-CoA synthetase